MALDEILQISKPCEAANILFQLTRHAAAQATGPGSVAGTGRAQQAAATAAAASAAQRASVGLQLLAKAASQCEDAAMAALVLQASC